MRSSSTSSEIGWFVFWLVAFTTPVAVFTIAVGDELPMLSRMSMWCPGAAALMTCAICGVDVRGLGWRWPSVRFLAIGYGLPWLYAIPVYVLTWALIPGSFTWGAYASRLAHDYGIANHASIFAAAFGVPTTMIFVVIGTMAWALGEEIGWRGFLVPRLMGRLGFVGTGVSSGLLWAVWHYPILIGSNYNAGTPVPYALACFTLMVVSMGVVAAWLRLASGSIWPCVVLHASHNTLIQAVLDAMTNKSGRAPYVTTEFGFGMAVLYGVLAIVVVRSVRYARSADFRIDRPEANFSLR